jgi:copper chaperone CopZ
MSTLKVPDMNCEHCVARITKALEEQKLNFKVSLVGKTVEIDGDETAVKSAFAALEGIGYDAFAT